MQLPVNYSTGMNDHFYNIVHQRRMERLNRVFISINFNF